jgi:hypothetical protein
MLMAAQHKQKKQRLATCAAKGSVPRGVVTATRHETDTLPMLSPTIDNNNHETNTNKLGPCVASKQKWNSMK